MAGLVLSGAPRSEAIAWPSSASSGLHILGPGALRPFSPGVLLQSLLGLHISSVLRYHSASHSVGTLVITLRTHPDAPG